MKAKFRHSSFGFLQFLNQIQEKDQILPCDMQDIKNILDGGEMLDYAGTVKSGPYRSLRAGVEVTENFDRDYKGVVFYVTGSSDLLLSEVNEVAEQLYKHCTPDTNIIFGAMIDERFSKQIRVDVVGVR